MIDFDALVNAPICAAFGEELVYTVKSSGASKTINAPFREPCRQQEFGADGVPKWTLAAPSVGARLLDLPAQPAKGDRILRRLTGRSYSVSNAEPDGVGWVVLSLKEMQ